MKPTLPLAAVVVLIAGCAQVRSTPLGVDHPAHPDAVAAPVAPPSDTLVITPAASTQPTAQAAVYVCPMHPDVTSDKPGTCPKCGMQLVEKAGK